MNLGELGNAFVLLILIFSFYKIGEYLVDKSFSESPFFWIILCGLIFFGWLLLQENNLIGLLGFVPVGAYIILKSFNDGYSGATVRRKIKSVVLSVSTSSIMYVVTHTVFGFGIAQASISAIFTAGVLALAGFSS